MNVLVIGSGGREHAIAKRISESESLEKLYIVPGNPGTENLGENISLDTNDKEKVINLCKDKSIDLVVIGPEDPLVNGLGDELRKNGISVFGPNSNAAEIEAHKSFAKNLMRNYGIPTAEFKEYEKNQFDEAKNYLETAKYPLVIKADGLAAGKGVLICENLKEALAGMQSIFVENQFGAAGNKIVIEEFMVGEEASIFAITDGNQFVCLPAAQDHKRIGNGDTGKNTGGMGAYAPAPIISADLQALIDRTIIEPTINALRNEGRSFIGCLYAGLMITNEGPKVVEFNCRFGDPETQAVLPLLEGDFLKLLYSASIGKLDKSLVKYNGGSSVCIVAASGGYPESYQKGFEINGLNALSDEKEVIVYHAGTKKSAGKIFTNGGRVLGVTSVIEQNDLKIAKEKAYLAIQNISFEGIYFRNDITDKAFKHL